MKEYIQELINTKGLQLALIMMLVIITLNVALVTYYRALILDNSDTQLQIQKVKDRLSMMDTNIRLADIGVRAYIIKQDQDLLRPYTNVETSYAENLDSLEKELIKINYDLVNMVPARNAIDEYMRDCKLMVDLCDAGRVSEAIEVFEEDRGYTAWVRYDPFIQNANQFIGQLNAKNAKIYKSSLNLILITQVVLILISFPILTSAYRKIVKENKFRRNIFAKIKNSNKDYLFDDGKDLNVDDENLITQQLIDNLKKAASFINSITKGNYNIEWEGMDGGMAELNKQSLAGELVMMKDQMQKAKKEDEQRIWTNAGLSKFGELIRKHQDNLKELSELLITNIVEYLGAQQGGLFFVSEDDQNQRYLEMMGCYAYQRKKFLEKRIELGQGMVGQCFLEGETTYVTNIPNEYVNITSGLGQTNPSTLLIVPLKINDEVVGVVEIASLKKFERHQIEFVERISEMVASSISTVKSNESTKALLEQSQQQAEEMRAQEEEMRQNMEELQATQEQMHRKTEEVEQLLKTTAENEKLMKEQVESLEKMQEESIKNAERKHKEIEDYKNMLMDILNEIPQKIFLKDENGKIYIANQQVADAHGLPLAEIIGKSDYDFVDKETADEWRQQELKIMEKGSERYIFEDTIGGKKTILESTKKVFNIRTLNQIGLLGIQADITEKIALQDRAKGNQSAKK